MNMNYDNQHYAACYTYDLGTISIQLWVDKS